MTATRRLAAIMAIDVVGYSRLARADEDRMLRARAWLSKAEAIEVAVQPQPRQQSAHGATSIDVSEEFCSKPIRSSA